MSVDSGIVIEGLEELKRKLGPGLFGPPARNMLRKAGSWGRNKTAEKAPKDLYSLATSFTLDVDPSPFPGWADVSSNARNARPMEYGTGLLSDAPDSKHTRHHPPGRALEGWALRHGFDNGYQVAAGIYKRGGLSPRRFLRDAWRELSARMDGYLREMIREVERIWQQ